MPNQYNGLFVDAISTNSTENINRKLNKKLRETFSNTQIITIDQINNLLISSNFVFVRVRNSEFNYSTNPSNITSSGELRHDVMINSPQAYITTVGLYNDNNDLVAVAKLSRPLVKDFTKEALVRVKLDF